MLVYCDSVILIYYLDASDAFHQRAAQRLAAMHAAGDEIAVSDLTRLECRTSTVYDRATLIRAQYAFKTTDALHLAAALEGACDRFLTHDVRLAKFTGIPVEVLP